jgi:GNAT superfamily N-acetyltransferase
MISIRCCEATEADVGFIAAVYAENMAALHGAPRSRETWVRLLAQPDTIYYIVYTTEPAGRFRLDKEADGAWLGMLQIRPAHQRQGLGRAVLAKAEALALQWGYRSLGIHTTQDNGPARGLYTACGYTLREIGPCTTADGVERIGYTFCKNL